MNYSDVHYVIII